jgi:flagellar hook-basal body complex protein FliE
MVGSVTSAISAYQKAAQSAGGVTGGDSVRSGGIASSFEKMVKSGLSSAIDTAYQSESDSKVAVATGKTELHDLVTSVTNAELAVETVVAIRDRVINAYQEIMKMPI